MVDMNLVELYERLNDIKQVQDNVTKELLRIMEEISGKLQDQQLDDEVDEENERLYDKLYRDRV